RLPLRRLKMDLELLRAVPADPRQSILVRGIIQMANALGLECVAEGVETQAQASFLRQQGCGLAQGYLFAEPMGGVELSDWLEDYPGGHDQLASMASKRA
ncbi:MAG: EAL domain-containing protein, partial [Anaerolineae bacterium]|nr:EAL domain-containing protein [Anaerolineae bacterium]